MASGVKIPPKPKRAPDVHLKGAGARRKPPRTLKGDLRALKGKASKFRSKWGDDRKEATKKKEEVRKKAAEILTPVKEKVEEEKKLLGEVMKPVQKVASIIRVSFEPGNGRARPYVSSFLLSCILSWAVGPQILIALYERIRFGTSTTGWGILNGPGRWFRDTVGMAVETGQTKTLVWSAVLGLTPMIILGVRNLSAGYLAQVTYRGKLATLGIQWLTRAAYLTPLLYLVGISYPGAVTWLFGSPWILEWWQIWVMALFCITYYFTAWVLDRIEKLNAERSAMSDEERAKSQDMGPGIFHAVLMVPAASVISGVLLYAPGAAW